MRLDAELYTHPRSLSYRSVIGGETSLCLRFNIYGVPRKVITPATTGRGEALRGQDLSISSQALFPECFAPTVP